MILKTAVIGDPITHSRSPLIHSYWIEKYSVDAIYSAELVRAENLEVFCDNLRASDWRGCNVTIPHKENVTLYLDEIDETARSIGAVNTVINQDGRLVGRNTDGFGFIENIKDKYPVSYAGKKIVVLGAGGAARAVLSALIAEGAAEICIVNRNLERAQKLKDDFALAEIEIADWDHAQTAINQADMIVNTTSLGMKGQPELEINLSSCRNDVIVCDIVYNPLQTELLKQASALNLRTVDGIGMLLHQARLSFYYWFDILPDVTAELRAKVMAV